MGVPSTLVAGLTTDADKRRDRLEAAFCDMRMARRAKAVLEGQLGVGAVVCFEGLAYGARVTPTGTVPAVYPLQVSIEPGSYLTRGLWEVKFHAEPSGWLVEGSFFVSVGAGEPPREVIEVTPLSSPPATAAPVVSLTSLALPLRPQELVELALRRLVRRGENAMRTVVEETQRLIYSVVNKALASSRVPGAEFDEMFEAGVSTSLERITKLAERYCGPDRPNAAWSKVVTLACMRDVRREARRQLNLRHGIETSMDPDLMVALPGVGVSSGEEAFEASLPRLLSDVFGTGDQLVDLMPWLWRIGLSGDDEEHSLVEVAAQFVPRAENLSERRQRKYGSDAVASSRLAFLRRFAEPGEDEKTPGAVEAWEMRALEAVRRHLSGEEHA
jgi:hypothetical protein